MSDVKIKVTADASQAATELQRTAALVKAMSDQAEAIRNRVLANIGASKNASASSGFAGSEGVFAGRKAAVDAKETAAALQAEAIAANAAAKAMDAVGAAAGGAAIKKKDLKDAIKSLSQAVPGLSVALTLLKNPYVIAAAGIAGFVSALKNQIAIQDEAARKSAELATSLGPLFEQMRQATSIAEAAAAAQSYADSIDAARLASQTSATDLEKANTAAKTENDHLAKKTELLRDLARLDIKIDQSTGKISGEQAASRLAALGGQFAREDSAAAIAAQAAESARLQKAAEDASARAESLRSSLPGLEADAAASAKNAKQQPEMSAQSAALRKARSEEIAKEMVALEQQIAFDQQSQMRGEGTLGNPYGLLGQAWDQAFSWSTPALREQRMKDLAIEQRTLQQSQDGQGASGVSVQARAEADARRVEATRKAIEKADAEAARFAGQEASVATGLSAAQQSAAELNPLRDANVRVEQNLQTIEENKRRAAEEDALRRALDAEALRRGPRVGDGASLDALIDPTRDLAESIRTIVGHIQEANRAVALLDAQVRNSRGQV